MFDYTVFTLQRSFEADITSNNEQPVEQKVYTQIPQETEDDLIVVHKYQQELSDLDADIQALADHYDAVKEAMENGTPASLSITLQELNAICPRRRVRVDAYNRLVRILATKNITLTITSRKSHG